jgi:GT2 family glycosyltransferase
MSASFQPGGKRLVVVLGMHRSGTSAITRALEVFGVELGERLMAARPDENEKGFFEDVEVNALNLEIYQALGGGQAWHTLSPIPDEALAGERAAGLKRRAVDILGARLRGTDLFGLKDPAMCRLLPFWQPVFRELGVDASYAIALRNPISVARSLEKRDGLPAEKCHYLWQQHVVPSVMLTRGAPRVVVDYDRLMDAPEEQVIRMGRALGLAGGLDRARLAEFSREFLEERLRHARFGAEDAAADPRVPVPVRKAYALLTDAAADRASLESEAMAAAFATLSEQLEGMAQALGFVVHLDSLIVDRDNRVKALEWAARQREVQLTNVTRDLSDRETRLKAQGSRLDSARAAAAQGEFRLRRLQASAAWRLARPLRMLRGLRNKLSGRLPVALVPFSRLQPEGDGWQVTGGEPQFLLVADRPWQELEGWCWLHVDARQPLTARVFFDSGLGFDPALTIGFHSVGDGVKRVPLFIPPECQAVRLDPLDAKETFGLSIAGLERLARAPALSEEFASQSAIYDELGAEQGDATALVPIGDVSPTNEPDYRWSADGYDPRFLLRGVQRRLKPGWCLVEMCMRLDVGFGNAKVYFNMGGGYSEADAVILPYAPGKPVERLYRLPAAARRIRFDPIETLARFTVERLQLANVTPEDARARMLARVREHFEPYRDKTHEQIWEEIGALARQREAKPEDILFRQYNDTYTLYSTAEGSTAYEDWIERKETPEFSARAAIEARQRGFAHLPLVSVIVPTYNTPEALLQRTLESVIAQSYPRWELCIADDASPEPHVRAVLEDYARRDPRVKVTFRAQNGHISAASNSALALATGDYVALLDHDDELAPHALHFVVDAINANPAAQILYSDEDKIDERGNRSSPLFKPDWNPDLFFSQNYVSHLGVYRRGLVEAVGGFRVGMEGSQDHDLLLRCLAHVDQRQIVHVPKVLYHWRILEGSTALNSGEKRYAVSAGIRALEDYFRERGEPEVKVEPGLAPNTYRVRYPIPRPEPLVSLLVPTRDRLDFLEPCLKSLLGRTSYPNFEIVVIDNGSVEPATLGFLEHIEADEPRVRVLRYNVPFNFSAINNHGVRHARGELVGLVNNDIEVISPEWLTEMASHALRPEIGCVGAKLYYQDDTIQHAGVITGLGGVAGHSHKYFPREAPGYFYRLKLVQNLSAVTAACLVVRKSVYEEVGGLDEKGLGIAFNDVDFCLKVREAGYRNLWTPYAELYHYESKSRGTENTPDKVERFNSEAVFMQKKWKDKLNNDPCYSPNLTLAREDFSLR